MGVKEQSIDNPIHEPVEIESNPKGLKRFLILSAVLAILMAAGASIGVGQATHPNLWAFSRGMTILAGFFTLAGLGRFQKFYKWWPRLSLVAGFLALVSAVGHNRELHLSVFESTHSHLLGMPSAIPFILLALSGRMFCKANEPRGIIGFHAIALTWVSATFVIPSISQAGVTSPVLIGFSLLAKNNDQFLTGITLILLLAPILAGWLQLFSAMEIGWGKRVHILIGKQRVSSLVNFAPILLMLYHYLAPLIIPETASYCSSAMVGSIIGLLFFQGARITDALTNRNIDLLMQGRHVKWLNLMPPIVFLFLFFLLKIPGLAAFESDENIYFYMARDLSEGKWPYADYFFSHPPLSILALGGLFTIFGYSFLLAKAFSPIVGGVIAITLWLIAKREFGVLAAMVTLGSFVFALVPLKATTIFTGAELTTMWMLLGIWQALKGNSLAAGLLFGASGTTGIYSMAAVCAMLLLGFFRQFRFGIIQLVSFILFFGIVNLIFWLTAGDDYIQSVYTYHGLKKFQDSGMLPLFQGHNPAYALFHNFSIFVSGRPFAREIFFHSHLWLAFLLCPVAVLMGRVLTLAEPRMWISFLDPRKIWEGDPAKKAVLLWLVALALLIEFSMFHELYDFYFLLIYPIQALCLGYTVAQALNWISNMSPAPSTSTYASHYGNRLFMGLLILGILSQHEILGHGSMARFPEARESSGRLEKYSWRPAALWSGALDLTRLLFWKTEWVTGTSQPGYRHYLWKQMGRFDALEEISHWIKENSRADETIAGVSTLAPLVAIHSERRLAADEVDTNVKRYETGSLDEKLYWTSICNDRVKFIVSSWSGYFSPRLMNELPIARRWFKPVKTFWNYGPGKDQATPITLYERQSSNADGDSECRWEE